VADEVSIWQMSEAELLARVIRLCEERGIRWVHIDTPHHNKRRQNMTGFPDLFLCGSERVAFRELKRQRWPRTSPTALNFRVFAAIVGDLTA
jgi:hypothetical protein